jgi:hypothetical protein
MIPMQRLGDVLTYLWRSARQRLNQWRERFVSVTLDATGDPDADARRWADARRRFWSELRAGQREADSNRVR